MRKGIAEDVYGIGNIYVSVDIRIAGVVAKTRRSAEKDLLKDPDSIRDIDPTVIVTVPPLESDE